MTHSTHAYTPDPRNERILIDVNGELTPRAEAKVSVFDSGFVLGDGVWEGLRVYPGSDGKGVIAFLDKHMKRLFEGAKTLDFEMELNKAQLAERLYRCLDANDAHEGVHIRLMMSRGVKATPYQDPRATITPPTIIIIPEFKTPLTANASKGAKLFTAHVRRGYPDVQDQKLNSHSKLNCIMACIQAAKAGANEALMLDPHGFVATCNSTHFFILRDGELWTSTGDFCLGGITRKVVINMAKQAGITVQERNFSLHDVYNANEAFITGTFAGVTPVAEVDGRSMAAAPGPIVKKLQNLYKETVAADIQHGRKFNFT
ncbi:aminotransferase class IV [Hyphococcus sp.]|uniref:aminotransferase class IV n=1 Tax=Hyphococcus sp. TaxID=2038636 RepID=UPI002089B247|nr:MAG: aminotransferase class IV [Marinicaulis sp.]